MVADERSALIDALKRSQSADGSWRFPFETGISTDAYMIILLRTLEINDEPLIQALVERIESRQEANGAWKLFADEGDGNVTATVEAYYALLYSGYRKKTDPHMQKAKARIVEMGGLERVHLFTKVMLALTGQHPWPRRFPLPLAFFLLPPSFPLNIYDLSVYGRANMAPLLVAAERRYSRRTAKSPDLSDLAASCGGWRLPENRALWSYIKRALIGFPAELRDAAKRRAVRYMFDHIEPDGTLYSYFSSTFLVHFCAARARLSDRRPAYCPSCSRFCARFAPRSRGHVHMQYTTASVWNTALASYALQEAGVPPTDRTIEKANRYLLSRQHIRYGDWAVHNPYGVPGGWGFSDVNTMNPDVDDTTAALRAIRRAAAKETAFRHAWDRANQWLFSMQNDDGGFAAFEKNVGKRFWRYLPIEGAEFLLMDPSTADLTGRTL